MGGAQRSTFPMCQRQVDAVVDGMAESHSEPQRPREEWLRWPQIERACHQEVEGLRCLTRGNLAAGHFFPQRVPRFDQKKIRREQTVGSVAEGVGAVAENL